MRTAALVVLALHAPLGRAQEPTADAKGVEFFENKVRPVLVEHWYKCHSAAANKTKGGLALDTPAGLREGGESGPAVVPGEPAKGTLLKSLRHDGPVKLPDTVVADLAAWVVMGAPDPRGGKSAARKGIDYADARKHWAYRPVKPTPSPTVAHAAWPVNDIDRFVLAGIEAKGVKPAADAAKSAWLRRATFDLTGLPPTPEDVAAYLSDATPRAAETVDRLLASPRFGEHWARHWLDGVRFDPTVPTSNRYRDWVVRALNADVPYDEFVRFQIAGDLLPPSADVKVQADRIAATQFLALSCREMDPVEGMVEVFGQHVLGVSINCAKCHGHKLDAYSQLDAVIDGGMAALLTDLKRTGLLDSTLVMWGGEFGRTPYAQGKDGRDHFAKGFTYWPAGGGAKRGVYNGETDAVGMTVTKNPVHVHDLHATVLHLMGLDPEKLTCKYGGRDQRLTDVSGKVVPGLIA